MLVRKDLLEKRIDMAGVSVEYLNSAEHWITVHPKGHEKGQPLLVKDGETNKEAIDRKFSKSDDKELTKSQIEKKIDDIYADNKKLIGNAENITQFLKDNPKIKEKVDNNRKQVDELIRLKDKAKNDIKTEPVLNLSVKLIEDTGGFSLKTRTINTEIKNPDKAKLKDYKSWLKREALKQNKGFRFHSFSTPSFEDKRV